MRSKSPNFGNLASEHRFSIEVNIRNASFFLALLLTSNCGPKYPAPQSAAPGKGDRDASQAIPLPAEVKPPVPVAIVPITITGGGTKNSRLGDTTYLLLHGLNSDASTWDSLVESSFENDCAVLTGTELDTSIPKGNCYRYNFITRTGPDGVQWQFGDGATFSQLGEEVARLVASARKKNSPKSIVFVAHSRGGLASRAYLQDKTTDNDIKFGLLTIGTPHRGTSMGMMKHFFVSKGIKPTELPFDSLKFLLSPSTGYLAQAFLNTQPVRNAYSEEIWKLQDKVPEMLKAVTVLGQIYSVGLRLGENLAPGVDAFSSSPLNPARVLPGDFDAMKAFVLDGVPGYWNDGDNMVPAYSAKLSDVPGVLASKIPLLSNEMSKKVHADPIQFEPNFVDKTPNDGITGQSGRIQLILEGMTDRPEFTKYTVTK
jgi:hypothetical protein